MTPHPHSTVPTLETARLVLRHPLLSDAPDVQETHRHRSVADAVISIPHPCPPEHGLAWIEWARLNISERMRVWVIQCQKTGRVIGDCGVEITPGHRRGTIGYLLHPDRQGEGLMTEALEAVLRHLFTDHDPPLERVEADVYPDNTPSLRLCEKLGFSPEGLLRGFIRKQGAQRDVVRLSVLRSEYRCT